MLNKLKSVIRLNKVLNAKSAFSYLFLKYFKNNSPKTYNFKLRNNLDILVTPKQGDLCTFYEIFVQEVYDSDIKRNGNKTINILDIGANVGYFSLYASKKFNQARIFSFEPYHKSLTLFNKHLGMNRIKNINVYQLAVSSKCGETTLYSIDWSGCNTLIPDRFDEGHFNRNKVECIDLQRLFEITSIDSFDLAKIDCEGSEYPILLNSNNDDIRKIKNFVIEIHDDKRYKLQDLVDRFIELKYDVRFEDALLKARIKN